MTPDPEPEPEPTGFSFDVQLSNALNNTYMVVLKYYPAGSVTGVPFAGGTAVIGQWNDIGTVNVPEDNDGVLIYLKAYNNQYTSWDDSYYSDATFAKGIGTMESNDGKTLKITVQGSSSVTTEVV